MTLYTRHQLLIVLLIAGAAGAGLAIDHWRRASPELVERLERLDRAERAAPEPAAGDARRPARESRRARETRRDATPETPLDVNRATAPELARLPGIGPALAARIVEARPFTALDDLARVPGLRRATLERVRPFLRGTLEGFPTSRPLLRGTLGGFPSSPPALP
jgi:competence protein ComEA